MNNETRKRRKVLFPMGGKGGPGSEDGGGGQESGGGEEMRTSAHGPSVSSAPG